MRQAAVAAILIVAPCVFAQPLGPSPLPSAAKMPEQPVATPAQPVAIAPTNSTPLNMPADAAATRVALPQESRPLGVGEPADMGGDIAQTLIVLTLIVVGIIVGGRMMKRYARGTTGLTTMLGPGGRAPSGVLSVLGRFPVGPGHQIVLLRVERRILVLSQTMGRFRSGGGSFTTLSEITDPEEVASLLVRTQDEAGESMNARFREMLAHFDETDPSTMRETARSPLADRLDRLRGRASREAGAAW